ncbi:hypothetical protein JVU11DRAFT_2079 [Chiua virens]|nr:hypothetical protein JVU11DRAFT_2079 [Chiua virens]
MPSSPPPSGSLLERIGGTVEDEAGSIRIDSDRIDGEIVASDREQICTDVPFSSSPHFHTPEPGEVERFLQSVIGTPTSPHVYSGNKPTLALETHNLPVDHHLRSAEDPSSSVFYSPTQTAVNSLPSANVALDHCQKSPLGGTMPWAPLPLPTSAIEECKKHLAPVLLASARARDPGTHLDSEQCYKLLSDDHCSKFFRKAKEMRRQLSFMAPHKLPAHQSSDGSLKRDRVDEVETWARSTRSRFNFMNPGMSDVSRRDSDITPADFIGGRSPPKAPRAMLHASQAAAKNDSVDGAPKISSLVDARLDATHEALITSPTTEGNRPASTTNLSELVQQVSKMLPVPGQPVAEVDTPSNVSVGQPATPQSGHPHQVVSLTQPTLSSAADFVSHLPSQPGIWFKQQGRKYSEIVNVDVEVSREMFYLSAERLPSRVRMHLHLCSVPASIINDAGDTAATMFQRIKDVIDRRVLHWPKKGSLVIQINPDSEGSKTWLHHHLESDPLDVTSCIRPGKNVFRFIQLSDLSNYTFMLVASPPSEEEAWRSWDWASLVARPHVKAPSSGLSEFAHLPITIRS